MRGSGVCIPSFDKDDGVADVVAALCETGAVIVRGLLAPELMDMVTAKLQPAFEQMSPGADPFTGQDSKIKALGRVLTRGNAFSDYLLLNRVCLEVADAILRPQCPMASSAAALSSPPADWSDTYAQLGRPREAGSEAHCHHYRVNAGAALQVCMGGNNQPLHRETDIYRPFLEHDPLRPECILACNWAGTDFTRENGATRLVPGSHRWPPYREAEEHEVAQAEMPKGSAVFWLGGLLHGAGANHTDEPRTGIIFTLAVNWLATEENQYLAVPPAIARTLPERAQQLLGYRSSPSLGCIAGRPSDNWLSEGLI